MALITCPECRQKISSEALSCPHCGISMEKIETAIEKQRAEEVKLRPIRQQRRRKLIIISVLSTVILVILGLIISSVVATNNRNARKARIIECLNVTPLSYTYTMKSNYSSTTLWGCYENTQTVYTFNADQTVTRYERTTIKYNDVAKKQAAKYQDYDNERTNT